MGKSTISMAIFNSYVKLPEGTTCRKPENQGGSQDIPNPDHSWSDLQKLAGGCPEIGHNTLW